GLARAGADAGGGADRRPRRLVQGTAPRGDLYAGDAQHGLAEAKWMVHRRVPAWGAEQCAAFAGRRTAAEERGARPGRYLSRRGRRTGGRMGLRPAAVRSDRREGVLTIGGSVRAATQARSQEQSKE